MHDFSILNKRAVIALFDKINRIWERLIDN